MNNKRFIGSAYVQVGNDSAPFSDTNTVVKDGIVDGGIFPLSLVSGDYFALRRDGPDPVHGESRLYINEIKIYETPNLI